MQAVRPLTLRLRTSTPTATAPCSGTPVGRRSLTASLYCAVGRCGGSFGRCCKFCATRQLGVVYLSS